MVRDHYESEALVRWVLEEAKREFQKFGRLVEDYGVPIPAGEMWQTIVEAMPSPFFFFLPSPF